MNYELLEKVKQHILAEPNRLTMGTEIQTGKKLLDPIDGYSDMTHTVSVEPPCETAACIAGWTVILAHPELKPSYVFAEYSVPAEANKLLKLEQYEIDSLYYTNRWPEDLRERFKTEDLTVRAQVAAEVIDRFVERKKKEETTE